MTLPEIAFWTISLPLAAYYASFTPIFLYREGAVAPWAIVPWHIYMAQLQESVIKHHPYQSVWWQWAINWRPIWYLYQVVDGSQRGVLLLGNPFTMLAGLAAMVWCLARGAGRRRWPDVLAALAYLATLGLWMVHAKPVQFYYHYLLPGALLMACLALALDALWRKARARWWRWAAVAPLVLSLALFAGFFPILAALPLHHGARSFETWMWLPSWR